MDTNEIEKVADLVAKKLEKRSGIFSSSLLRRAFTVYGHSILAGLIISVILYVLGMILGLLSVSSGFPGA